MTVVWFVVVEESVLVVEMLRVLLMIVVGMMSM
jgi:hypothetical protein